MRARSAAALYGRLYRLPRVRQPTRRPASVTARASIAIEAAPASELLTTVAPSFAARLLLPSDVAGLASMHSTMQPCISLLRGTSMLPYGVSLAVNAKAPEVAVGERHPGSCNGVEVARLLSSTSCLRICYYDSCSSSPAWRVMHSMPRAFQRSLRSSARNRPPRLQERGCSSI